MDTALPATLTPSEQFEGTYSSAGIKEATDTEDPGPSSYLYQLSNETDNDDEYEGAYIHEIYANDLYRIY